CTTCSRSSAAGASLDSPSHDRNPLARIPVAQTPEGVRFAAAGFSFHATGGEARLPNRDRAMRVIAFLLRVGLVVALALGVFSLLDGGSGRPGTASAAT